LPSSAVYLFEIPTLNDKIEQATAKLSKERVIVTLTKDANSCFTWHDIKKS